MTNNDWFQQAAEAVRCSAIEAGTGIAAYGAVTSLLTGQLYASLGLTAGAIALEALAIQTGCRYNPNNPPGLPGGGVYQLGCTEVDGIGDFRASLSTGTIVTIAEGVKSISYGSSSESVEDRTFWNVTYPDGTTGDALVDNSSLYGRFYIDPREGSECVKSGGTAGPGPTPDEDPIFPPEDKTDPDGCTWSFTINNIYIGAKGLPILKYKVESNDPENCGGPFEFWQQPDGEIEPIGPNPDPDGDGTDLADQQDQILGGIRDIKRKLDDIEELLEDFECEEPELGSKTYTLKSFCETDDECNPVEKETTAQAAGGPASKALASRMDAIVKLLQAHKDYKQPICGCRPELKGNWRTISFISDEQSPFGNDRLRKRFRYRSSASGGLGDLIDHWKDFTWQAGSTCVQHKGASWGTPQCWARSVDEGKRVIQHAGREAGIDPNQVGEWVVSSSDNPRYGVSGTMRVCEKGGYYWITDRNGADGRPEVGYEVKSPNP